MLLVRVQACQNLSLQAALGQEEAERAAQAAMAAATAVMQGKRVEILVPPQAAAWLQVCLRLSSCHCHVVYIRHLRLDGGSLLSMLLCRI